MKPNTQAKALVLAVLTTWAVIAPPAAAQIAVIGGDEPNLFTLSASPVRADIATARDVFISDDLEVGGRLFLDGAIHLNRVDAEEMDQFVYFTDDGSAFDESFSWDESADAFSLTNDLDLLNGENAAIRIRARAENELQLLSETYEMYFLIDSNANDDGSMVDHTFTWANNNFTAGQRAMVLRSATGDVGDLEIAGTLSSNTNFDLAENFWMSEPAAPGQLVAVDPTRPDAVVLAHQGSAERVVGVVSTAPGVVLGRGAFSPEALRATWGGETAAAFEAGRAALEGEILAENSSLRQEAGELASPGAYAAALLARSELRAATAPAPEVDNDLGPVTRKPFRSPSGEEYADALRAFETRLGDAVMKRFFARHFAPVALAGRVPVEVDAGLGPIRPGDPLTVSDRPGVARRADGPGPVVGIALEGLDGGSGRILMLVQRSRIGGPPVTTLARAEAGAAAAAELAALRADNLRLARRLAEIEGALERLGLVAARVADSR